MKYKSHLITAIITTSIVIYLLRHTIISLPLNLLILIPIMIYFGANFPDLDHWASKIRRYIFTLVFMFIIGLGAYRFLIDSIYIALITAGLIGLVAVYSIHRCRMHTARLGLIFSLPLMYFHWSLALIFFTAFVTHIMTDKAMSKIKRKLNKFLASHPTIESYLERKGIVGVRKRYVWKKIEKL